MADVQLEYSLVVVSTYQLRKRPKYVADEIYYNTIYPVLPTLVF